MRLNLYLCLRSATLSLPRSLASVSGSLSLAHSAQTQTQTLPLSISRSGNEDDQTLAATPPGVGANDDDDGSESGGSISTINPSVLGIIHLVDVTTTTTELAAAPIATSAPDESAAGVASGAAAANESSSKVIRIYFPAKAGPLSGGASPNKREDESSQSELARHSNRTSSAVDSNQGTTSGRRNSELVRPHAPTNVRRAPN